MSYREELEAWGASVGSDGCTAVPEFYRVCCLEHDHAYVTGQTMRGRIVSKYEADQRFRDCIQVNSTFRWASPMSWWRWLAVHTFGGGVWGTPIDQRMSLSLIYTAQAEAMTVRQRIIQEIRHVNTRF